MNQPYFIAFEGIDGSGKSTQVKLLKQFLESQGGKVHTTAEPTSGPIGKIIRDIFSHRYHADQKVIAGLFVADRLDHLLQESDGMLQLLKAGNTVITDRYYFSSYAYHGVHCDLDWVIQSNEVNARLLRPDYNLFIDVAPELSMERIKAGRQSLELYETLDNLKRVRDKYFESFEKLKDQEHIIIIDGNGTAEEVAEKIQKIFLSEKCP